MHRWASTAPPRGWPTLPRRARELSAATGRTHAEAAEVAGTLRAARPASKGLVDSLGEASSAAGGSRTAGEAKVDARVLSVGIEDVAAIPTTMPKQAAALKKLLRPAAAGSATRAPARIAPRASSPRRGAPCAGWGPPRTTRATSPPSRP